MIDLTITHGDTFTVAPNEDGDSAIRIDNQAWVEEPRWLTTDVHRGDRERYLSELIASLTKLRDQPRP